MLPASTRARHSPPSSSRSERATLERIHQLVMRTHDEVGGLSHPLARPRLYSSDKMCVSSCATFFSWRDSGLRMSCRCVDKGFTSWREVKLSVDLHISVPKYSSTLYLYAFHCLVRLCIASSSPHRMMPDSERFFLASSAPDQLYLHVWLSKSREKEVSLQKSELPRKWR